MNEVRWRVPHGYPDWIEASTDGRVRRLARQVIRNDGKSQSFPAKELRSRLNFGYAIVGMRIDGEMHCPRVHRLVMLAHAYQEGCEVLDVNHKNGDRAFNRFENLEWCTRSENHLHAYRVLGRRPPTKGRVPHNKGIPNVRCHVPIIAIDAAGNEAMRFESIAAVRRHGYDNTTVSHCLSGRMKTAYGFQWRRA